MSARHDETKGLKLLGAGSMPTPARGPEAAMLEAFPNRYPERPYIIRIEFPEFTSLCPVTGQPDFGTIAVEYIPGQFCVESKSFKLYMFAWRNHAGFMETITNTILDDLVATLDPLWCRVMGLFVPRGGTSIHVYAQHFHPDPGAERCEEVRRAVQQWLMQPMPPRLHQGYAG